MHIVCSFTSSYFSIYDDEYKRVHYNNDGHAYMIFESLLTSGRSATVN